MTQMALRWILDYEASSPNQAHGNARISDLPSLSKELHRRLSAFYEQHIHEHLRGPY